MGGLINRFKSAKVAAIWAILADLLEGNLFCFLMAMCYLTAEKRVRPLSGFSAARDGCFLACGLLFLTGRPVVDPVHENVGVSDGESAGQLAGMI